MKQAMYAIACAVLLTAWVLHIVPETQAGSAIRPFNLVANPGFERPTTSGFSWTYATWQEGFWSPEFLAATSDADWVMLEHPSYPGTQEVACDEARSGACSLHLVHKSGGGAAFQRIEYAPIEPGNDTVTVSLALKNPQGGNSAGKWFTVFLLFLDADATILAWETPVSSQEPLPDWQSIESDPVAIPNGTTQLLLWLSTNNGCGCAPPRHSWVDDVAIAVGPVPATAATAATIAIDAANCVPHIAQSEAGAECVVNTVHSPA